MATEDTLYNTNSNIHSEYYYEQITKKIKTAESPPRSVYSNADSSNT